VKSGPRRINELGPNWCPVPFYKNLGLALAGQGRYPDAAWSLLAAVHAEPRDPRAVRHLDALRRDHGAALAADAALTAALTACRALGREQN
jgi:hypothetical protein